MAETGGILPGGPIYRQSGFLTGIAESGRRVLSPLNKLSVDSVLGPLQLKVKKNALPIMCSGAATLTGFCFRRLLTDREALAVDENGGIKSFGLYMGLLTGCVATLTLAIVFKKEGRNFSFRGRNIEET